MAPVVRCYYLLCMGSALCKTLSVVIALFLLMVRPIIICGFIRVQVAR